MRLEFRCIEIGSSPNSTLSNLFYEAYGDDGCLAYTDLICAIIEDGHRDIKVPGETRITSGRYPMKKKRDGKIRDSHKRRWGHDFVMEITNVPNFTAVLVHTGNTIKDTEGCPLTNNGYYPDQDGNYVGIGSRNAYLKFWEVMAAFNFPDQMFWNVERFENRNGI